MRPTTSIALCAAALLLALLALGAAVAAPQDPGGERREIGRTTERELNIVLTTTSGSVAIGRGEPEKVLVAEAVARDHRPSAMNVSYEVRNRIGYLDLALGEGDRTEEGGKKKVSVTGLDGGEWRLQLSDALPISLDMELALGSGSLDLTGLQVRDFNLETGASDVTLRIDTPNRGQIETMTIESGVSRFVGKGLANANFRRLRFSGGMGTYELDFGGELAGEVDVDISLGVGLLTVIVPRETGAAVVYEKSWTSKISYDGDFRATSDTRSVTSNYATAKGKMNIRVESGMGSVRIKRR